MPFQYLLYLAAIRAAVDDILIRRDRGQYQDESDNKKVWFRSSPTDASSSEVTPFWLPAPDRYSCCRPRSGATGAVLLERSEGALRIMLDRHH